MQKTLNPYALGNKNEVLKGPLGKYLLLEKQFSSCG
jgi:hypothetical protein